MTTELEDLKRENTELRTQLSGRTCFVPPEIESELDELRAKLKYEQEVALRLCNEINEMTGPTFMGEPVIDNKNNYHDAYRSAMDRAYLAENELNELRAKLEELEKQEPCGRIVEFLGNEMFTFRSFVAINEMTDVYTRPVPAIPEGWQLVPIEPTDSMLLEITPANSSAHQLHTYAEWYRAMLAAAPKLEGVK